MLQNYTTIVVKELWQIWFNKNKDLKGLTKKDRNLWGNFLSLYSRFYEVTIFKSTYVNDEGKKMQYVFLDVKLRL